MVKRKSGGAEEKYRRLGEKMIFEDRLAEYDLPDMAKLFLPSALSDKTKDALIARDDMGEILKKAIEKIDRGSVESIETIVSRMCLDKIY